MKFKVQFLFTPNKKKKEREKRKGGGEKKTHAHQAANISIRRVALSFGEGNGIISL